jgi:hypothetical protein
LPGDWRLFGQFQELFRGGWHGGLNTIRFSRDASQQAKSLSSDRKMDGFEPTVMHTSSEPGKCYLRLPLKKSSPIRRFAHGRFFIAQ